MFYDDVEVGTVLPSLTFTVSRRDLIRYAGMSGDLNPVHWREASAREAGLPDIVAHGMLVMGRAARVLNAWTGDPGAIREYGVRFAKPVVVPDGPPYAPGVTVMVGARVAAKLDAKQVRIALTASCDGAKVLGAAYAVVQLR